MFNNSTINNKEMNISFKDKILKSKKKNKKSKMLTIILKSFDTHFVIATISSSITFSLPGIGLIVTPLSNGIACGLAISNKVKLEIILQNYNQYEKQHQIDQQTFKWFDKLHRRTLHDDLNDKNEYYFLCDYFNKHLDEKKNETVL